MLKLIHLLQASVKKAWLKQFLVVKVFVWNLEFHNKNLLFLLFLLTSIDIQGWIFSRSFKPMAALLVTAMIHDHMPLVSGFIITCSHPLQTPWEESQINQNDQVKTSTFFVSANTQSISYHRLLFFMKRCYHILLTSHSPINYDQKYSFTNFEKNSQIVISILFKIQIVL